MRKVRITTHPGEVLHEEFMRPLGLSANALARDLHVPPNRITSITAGQKPRAVTPDTALRLSRYFSTTPAFWLNLQAAYDLSKARSEIARRIEDEVRPGAA
jgi:addiction module HigA family antidote